ncbi:ATP-grasp fold amidoligase family protein [Pseudoalteromonas carrageenovora]|uniref:ATP-grasp fold amidoligase family protein n=1 Tax=Pseudoalteromonas carrageenovora TaxID=227 RepID=UPI0026E41D54|nr:ATP-grasp fold amidoligase family protein [Pseudoalteromonas carrageenovora]MDO6635775.1 ATP-grasp fold amidoligase family protein [Pseudoalteromonas carrageenovora]MDO6647768.1 ATP-grasp fold amidoligase family protein [Pseudoalteromonas carrageenovora]
MKKNIKNILRDIIRHLLGVRGYTFLRFIFTHKYIPKFNKPKTFSEKLIVRKFTVEPKKLSKFVDKYTVRQHVKDTIGEEYLIPLIKSVPYLKVSDFKGLPDSFVIKTSNGGGGENVLIVEDKTELDLDKICKQFNAYLKVKVGKIVDEHFYDVETPKIVFEKLIKLKDGGYPSDFKLHIFQGETDNTEKVIVQVDADRFENHKRSLYNEDLELLDYNIQPKYDALGSSYQFPINMQDLILRAKKLASPFKYVRVDMYNVDGLIYFGELTFCHGSGWEPMSSKNVDELWGSYWREFE